MINLVLKTAEILLPLYPELKQDEGCRKALNATLRQIKAAPHYSSVIKLEGGKLRVPKDLPEWKKTRSGLKKVFNLLTQLSDLLEDQPDEQTAAHVLRVISQADTNERLPELIAGISELSDLVASVGRFKGSAGNRPLATWMEIAVDELTTFWRDFSVAEKQPSPYFLGVDNEPGNDYTRFCCEVLTSYTKMTKSQCETILKSSYDGRRAKK